MLWPEISVNDIKLLDCVWTNERAKVCQKNKNFAGFVFFDIGGVLIDLDWDAFFLEYSKLLPANISKDFNNIVELLKNEGTWSKWCSGQMGAFEYANSLNHALQRTFQVKEKSLSVHEIKQADSYVVGGVRHRVVEFAKLLRQKNFGIGVLSNATTWHEIMIEKRLPVRDIFDVTIFSQDVGYEKPDPQIYKHAFLEAKKFVKHKYSDNLEAQDVYFIDDTPANVYAAREAGWQSGLVNLLNDVILQKLKSGLISPEELKVFSKQRENLLFGVLAGSRVEKIFGNMLE
jgi:HAD superfamily hydrolase (TIGR01509 family)